MPKLSKKTILVVDDEADIRTAVKAILEHEKFKVETAVDGDDALRKLKTLKPDLILLDIMMPGTPVKEVIKKIKGTKIAFCSVVRMADMEKEELMKQANIVDFIQKPFDLEDLVKRVKKYAGK
ncbi:response regulator [Candidatus Woesearchaeota archaeon]|nr:response regulator [Candidatus Woesearchaeota archaeon]